ncbi:unnamed protein product [Plutella xylostella]|uniref:(diamondback moth) hypothetical protein n=1 Tax=Plutella xylostella TaxID=51655 RepID=A0A8S4DS54_PLUXY|nr:unnamed protein product [Plutella xylostella]
MSLVQLVTMLVAAAAAGAGAGAGGKVVERQVFCGRRLADALDVLCENGLLLEKRSAPPALGGRWLAPPQPWLGRGRALARGRRHVVDECCLKPCTVDELMTYCA